MPTKKEILDSQNQSSEENLYKVAWVDKQTEDALNKLGTDTEKKFYEENFESKRVTYKIDVVKTYLSALYDEVKDMDTKSAWQYLVKRGNTSAWIMAVQIALESLWKEEYDLGRIDGIFKKGWTTEKAIKKFQGDNGLNPDGAPGKDTIRVLLEKLGEKKDEGGEEKKEEEKEDEIEGVKVKEEEQDVPTDREVEAGDLVEVPDGATAEFEEGSSVDKTKEGEQEVTVVVKVGDKVKRVVVIVEIEGEKMKTREKKEEEKEEEKEDEIEGVKVKEGEQDLPEWEVEAEHLVEVPDGAEAEIEGEKVDKTKEWEQEVTVVVKVGDKVKRVVVIVEIEGEKMIAKEKKEEVEDPFKNVKVKEKVDLPEDGEIEAKDLVVWVPEGATVEFEEEEDKVDKEMEEQYITVVVTKWDKVRNIVIEVKINKEDKTIKLSKISENDIDLEMIELEEARKIIKKDWDTDNIKRLDAELANRLVREYSVELLLNWLESLDKETATELAKFNGDVLSLDWLKSLDKETAAELANFKGENLYLNWLESLDKETATELAKFNGEYLSLDWLKSLDKETAAELAKFNGEYLSLDWLKSLDKETAAELAKFNGKGLYLNWLKSLGEETVNALATSKSQKLFMNWLESLEEKLAKKLYNYNGNLEMRWLKITESQAEKLIPLLDKKDKITLMEADSWKIVETVKKLKDKVSEFNKKIGDNKERWSVQFNFDDNTINSWWENTKVNIYYLEPKIGLAGLPRLFDYDEWIWLANFKNMIKHKYKWKEITFESKIGWSGVGKALVVDGTRLMDKDDFNEKLWGNLSNDGVQRIVDWLNK